jgi:hypothetical protein
MPSDTPARTCPACGAPVEGYERGIEWLDGVKYPGRKIKFIPCGCVTEPVDVNETLESHTPPRPIPTSPERAVAALAPACLGCGGKTKFYGKFVTHEWECAAEPACGAFNMLVRKADDATLWSDAALHEWLQAKPGKRTAEAEVDCHKARWEVALYDDHHVPANAARGYSTVSLAEAIDNALEGADE